MPLYEARWRTSARKKTFHVGDSDQFSIFFQSFTMRTAIPLLFLFFFFSHHEKLSCQNLIPDPGVEMITACPDNIGYLDEFLEHWFTVRLPSAFLHPCQDTLQLNGGWNNMFGYQEPLVGDGYIGGATYWVNQTDRRSIFGTEFTEPLEVGEEYHVSFHVAMAYGQPGSIWASDNIGFLLMTENYLDPSSTGLNPNFAHFAVDSIVTDTADWVYLHTTIAADSAYNMIAFGNFYDSEFTQVDTPYDETPTANRAFYFFDGFCVSKDSTDCAPLLSAVREELGIELRVFPVPADYSVRIQTERDNLTGIRITDMQGRLLRTETVPRRNEHILITESLPSGIYLLLIQTETGVVSRKLVVQHP